MNLFYTIFLIFGICSCTSVSIKDVNPSPSDPLANCDTTNITFAGTIKPIITTNCAQCHAATSPTSGISLNTYTQISRIAKSGELHGTITGAPGYIFMPKNGPPLAACDIKKIKTWIDAGSPNN